MNSVEKYENAPLFARRVGRIGAKTLRKIFAKYAENSAFTTLTAICKICNADIGEVEIRAILRETIVPAYNNGWLADVVTLKQLQVWVERRANLVLADPLVDIIGLHQYFLLHCLSSAVDAQKIRPIDVLERCPAAGYIHSDLFNDDLLDTWRSGAANVRMAIKEMEPRDGLTRWIEWVSTSTIGSSPLPLPILIED